MAGFAQLSLNLTEVFSSFGLSFQVTDIEKSLQTGSSMFDKHFLQS